MDAVFEVGTGDFWLPCIRQEKFIWRHLAPQNKDTFENNRSETEMWEAVAEAWGSLPFQWIILKIKEFQQASKM